MKKIYWIVGIVIIIILLGFFYLFSNPEYNSCDELHELERLEGSKIDFSCQVDTDCKSFSPCGSCVNKNVDTRKWLEINELRQEKGCIPSTQCQAFDCICLNNKCESKIR